MEQSKLGNKQICESCGTRFFDFGKTEIKCPNCGHVKLQTKQLTQKSEKEKFKPKKIETKKPEVEKSEDIDMEIEDNNISDDTFILEEMDDFEEIEIEDGKDNNNEN